MSEESETKPEPRGLIGEVTNNLGAVFRHMLPGVLIVGAAHIAHPKWFDGLGRLLNEKPELAWPMVFVGATVAIAVGNAWFAINRYIVHQFVDLICYYLLIPGPAQRLSGKGYNAGLATYVRDTLLNEKIPAQARQHVAFRASSVLLIYTIAELMILFANWNEHDTIFQRHPVGFGIIGSVFFVCGIWQNVITRRIDAAVLHDGNAGSPN